MHIEAPLVCWLLICLLIFLEPAYKSTNGLPARSALMHTGFVIHFVQTIPATKKPPHILDVGGHSMISRRTFFSLRDPVA